MNKPVVREIRVKHAIDECPETNWLGEYTDDGDDWNICRRCGEYVWDAERPNRVRDLIQEDMNEVEDENLYRIMWNVAYGVFNGHNCPNSHREFNYFKPYAGGEKPGTKEYREYGLRDFKRMEALERGDWHFIGVMAEAVVKCKVGPMWKIETFTSGGCWGVESDAEDYIKEIEKEELADLKRHLEVFGVDVTRFDEIEVTYE